ncbi:hypothetical protein MUN81_06295 [Hymenobacter sp. 5317J-9]|uniref:hypothetical protein n=1 Tax=Hymenobacter sp. 5317J-9 TaxID=2932250 RepID=UPI001FD689EB|nr:hypothetical protein [Hymenobacter sp. 5317J-9]UOQ99098.1 hypothetical protein MUN81_06295 [Hymenobacter sp. 5317J-9]
MEPQEPSIEEQIQQALGTIGTTAALRACFDPWSGEWDFTEMPQKVETLQKCVRAGIDVTLLARYYQISALRSKKSYSEISTQLALTKILTHLLA